MKTLLARLVFALLFNCVARRRRPDQIIGDPLQPYVLRWWLFGSVQKVEDGAPQFHADGRPILVARRIADRCVYLHCFLRSDEDRALHDHPWDWWSWMLFGPYKEHRDEDFMGKALENYDFNGSVEVEVHDKRKHYDEMVRVIRTYEAGSMRWGGAATPHRIELLPRASDASLMREFNMDWITVDDTWAFRVNNLQPVWTLFGMGEWKRDWGFHCPKGWVFWRDFTDPDSEGNEPGRGCGEMA